MKSYGFLLAFVISAALHAGVLSSNLLHVNAESNWVQKENSVQLHIVPTVRVPASAPKETAEKTVPKTDAVPNNRVRPVSDRTQIAATTMPEPKLPFDLLQAPVKSKPPERVLPPVAAAPMPVSAALSRAESKPEAEDVSDTASNTVFPGNAMQEDAQPDVSGAALAALNVREMNGTDFGVNSLLDDSEAQIPGLAEMLQYPRYCRLHNQEGTAKLAVEILADGSLGSIEVVHSSGYGRLDKAAVKAIRKSDPVPAKKGGRNVTSITRIDVKFDLEDWGE